MGVTRKYSRYEGGPDTDWLLGNTGETVTVELDVKTGFYLRMDDHTSPITLSRVRGKKIIMNGGSWEDYGFRVGDYLRIHLQWVSGLSSLFDDAYYEITNLSESTLEYGASSNSGYFREGEDIPREEDDGTRIQYVMAFPSLTQDGEPKDIEGVDVEYTLNDNQDSTRFSFIDNTITKFYHPNIQSLTIGQIGYMTYIDQKSGMGMLPTSAPRIYRLADSEDDIPFYFANYGFTTKRFKIVFDYRIHSFYDTVGDLIANIPPTELVETASLTDRFKIFCTPEFNNPNIGIEILSEDVLGNTGWFNENFNGLPEKFTLESVTYFNTNGIEIPSLAYNVPTAIRFEISGVDLSNLDNVAMEFGLIWTPETEEYYKDNERHLLQSFFHVSGREGYQVPYFLMSETGQAILQSGSGYDDKYFTPLSAQYGSLGADRIAFIMWVNPSIELSDFMDSISEHGFATWLSITDNLDEAPNLSNRVSLMVTGDMDFVEFNDGPYPQSFQILPHPFNIDSQASSNYTGFVKDDVCLRVRFKVDTNVVTRLRRMTFGMEIMKDSGLTYTLERVPVNLTSFPTDADGVQQIAVDSTRGFLLPEGNLMNLIKIEREPDFDIDTERAYVAYFGMKMRWEDWLARTDEVPQDFISSSKLNNGKNNDWFDYANTEDWNLNIVIYTELEEGIEVKNYKNRYPIVLKDYEDSDITVTHVYKKLSDGSVLDTGTHMDRPSGGIMDEEPTIIEITYTLSSGTFDTDITYANITIEPYYGQGYVAEHRISSVWDAEDSNPLQPLEGETRLKMEFSAGRTVLKTSCLVDPTLLSPSVRYEISGRVGEASFNIANPPIGGIYQDIYESQYE